VLAKVLAEAANAGVAEAVIGMAHRGRLNVLANIIGKALPKILSEFEENTDPLVTQGTGDVKYHLGSQGFSLPGRRADLRLPGPESQPPGVGQSGCRRDRAGQASPARDESREKVIPILIHGDAAFAGQGVVWETINLSQLHGYRTGAPSTFSSTTRSASRRHPRERAHRNMRPTSRGRFKRRSSTSTATTRMPRSASPGSPSNTASASRRML